MLVVTLVRESDSTGAVIPVRANRPFACEFGPSTALGNHAIVLMIGQPR